MNGETMINTSLIIESLPEELRDIQPKCDVICIEEGSVYDREDTFKETYLNPSLYDRYPFALKVTVLRTRDKQLFDLIFARRIDDSAKDRYALLVGKYYYSRAFLNALFKMERNDDSTLLEVTGMPFEPDVITIYDDFGLSLSKEGKIQRTDELNIVTC